MRRGWQRPLAALPSSWDRSARAGLGAHMVLVIWIGDSVALLAGRALGRQKLAPQISPNKSQ